jgi:DNA-binding transcriptional LysR family regulator
MVAKLQSTEVSLAESSAKPKGPFTLSVPATFGTIWVAQQMKEYTDLYPDIQVTLLCEDREPDISRREADAAIRFIPVNPARQPDIIQSPIMRLRNSLFASNDYLRQYGLPRHASDLKHHRLLGFNATGDLPFPQANWLYESKTGRDLTPFFRVNSLMAMRTAVKQGMGIAALPDYLMHRTRHISRVLPEIEGPTTEAFYQYPIELKNSKRIAVFRHFIVQKIGEFNF